MLNKLKDFFFPGWQYRCAVERADFIARMYALWCKNADELHEEYLRW